MKRFIIFILLVGISLTSCTKEDVTEAPMGGKDEKDLTMKDKIAAYALVEFTEENIDISHLTEQQRMLLMLLSDAGRVADNIFWRQSTPNGVAVRDSILQIGTPEASDILRYMQLNYGHYDVIYGQKRFAGSGPDVRPEGGGFYPVDMTKQEFEDHIATNPDDEELFKSQYTVITRTEGGSLEATPYSKYYPEVQAISHLLQEASNFCNNPSLQEYLRLRSDALMTDEYYASDLAWMDLERNDIDIVIGPIENYEDGLFNYKTAFECVVMVKDPKASKELQVFKDNMNYFQENLPTEGDYKKDDLGDGNIIQVVNAVYFGGDCNKGTKTIAAALPNDPKVAEAKGRKLSMYINHMKAKFNKIVAPIAEVLLDKKWAKYVDVDAFTAFVTLHEVSHATGPKYVTGTTDVDVRGALKERYSAIEETKADILSMYNHKLLLDKGIYDAEYIKKAQATYVAGLYRSIRFGTGAHCTANFIQLNYLQEAGAIVFEKGKFSINEDNFFDGVAGLAKLILDLQAAGDYEKAGAIIKKYGQKTEEIEKNIKRLSHLPRDIDTQYIF